MAKPQAQTSRGVTAARYQLVSVIGPTAGVDLRTDATLLERERAKTLVNFSLTEPGVLKVRPGWRHFSTSAISTSRIQGAARVYLNTALPTPNSTAFTLVAANQQVYMLTDSGGWLSTSGHLSGLSTNECAFVMDRDQVAVLDGSTRLWKSTNGSSWTRFGIMAGSAAPTVSTLSTGGVSSGEYEFAYTYKDRDLFAESNGSTSSTRTLTASSGAFSVVVPNSTDPQVDAIVVYARKISAGETILRKASSQSQSAGASSTLVVTSTSWQTNDEIPTDHDVPPGLSFGVVWKNRWWARSATVRNRLHFTQLFLPQAWPALFYVDIPFDRGDEIRAIVPLGDALIIFGTTRNYVITGQTSLDFEVRPALASEDGALGFRAVAVIENGVVHAGGAGVYIFDGATDKLLSFDIEPAWHDLVTGASVADLAKVALVYHQAQKELRIAVPRRYPSGTSGEWVLDLNRTRAGGKTSWTATDREVGGYILWDGPETQTGNRGRLFSWARLEGHIEEEAVGTSANGGDMTAQYEGPGLTLGVFRGRWVDLRVEYEPHAGTFSIEPLVDTVSQGTQTLPIGTGLAVYGTAVYGTDVYAGAGRRQAYTLFPLGAGGRTCTLRLIYTGHEAFKVFSYALGMVPESRPRAFGE